MPIKSGKLVASVTPFDRDKVTSGLNRAIEIVEAEPLNGLQGFCAIAQASQEIGYNFTLHYHAARLFVEAMNSDSVKIFAMKEAINKLK